MDRTRRNTDENYYTSASPFYWPASGGLDFYAWSPGGQELGGTVAMDGESQKMALLL